MNIIKKIFQKSRSKEDGIFFDTLQKIIGFPPIELDFYKKAFIHRSSSKTDIDGNPMNYERLEFLGDSMLSSIIAAFLYLLNPEMSNLETQEIQETQDQPVVYESFEEFFKEFKNK